MLSYFDIENSIALYIKCFLSLKYCITNFLFEMSKSILLILKKASIEYKNFTSRKISENPVVLFDNLYIFSNSCYIFTYLVTEPTTFQLHSNSV